MNIVLLLKIGMIRLLLNNQGVITMKRSLVFLAVIGIRMVVFPEGFTQCWINPDGWKIPDMKKVYLLESIDPKSLKIDLNVKIDQFDVREEFEPYLFYDKKIDYKKAIVFLNTEKERRLDRLKTFKNTNGEIVLYEISCFFIELVVHHKKSGQYFLSKIEYDNQYYLADLNQDGVFESCFESIDYGFVENLLKKILKQ